MSDAKRTSTGIRFPPELHAAMTAAAAERGFTLNAFVVRLCAEGMERLIPVHELRLIRTDTGEKNDGT